MSAFTGSTPRFYGSFLELALSAIPPAQDNVWATWTAPGKTFTFATARRALQWLVDGLGCARIWLPAYICAEVPAALAESICAVRYYAVDSHLESPPDSLREVMPGDAVLLVHLFGKPPSPGFLQTVQALQGVTLIEDCAHALSPEADTPAHWRLFSPRKLLGVPDGGLAVHLSGPCPPSPAHALPDAASLLERCAPAILGFEDAHRSLGQQAAYRHSEALLESCATDMMQISRRLLQCIDIQNVARRRQENWCVLHEILHEYALWPDAVPNFVPLVYPLQVTNPATVATALAAHNIFCPRHWATLPCPASFSPAHTLARRILSVPCDQRLTPEDMLHVGHEVRRQLMK